MGEKQRYVTGACDGERFANMYPSRSRLVLQQRPDPSEQGRDKEGVREEGNGDDVGSNGSPA
jgi:hypothetical protein